MLVRNHVAGKPVKKLHPIVGVPKGRVCWCGPGAASMLTGVNYEVVLDRIKAQTGKSRVKGMTNYGMKKLLLAYGLTLYSFPLGEKLTLAAFLRRRTAALRKEALLVEVTNHYMVIKGRVGGDNASRGPVNLKDIRKRRASLKAVWIVRGVEPITPHEHISTFALKAA